MDKCSDHSSCTNTNNIKEFVKVALKQLWDLWNARFGLWFHINSHSLTWVRFPENFLFLPKPEPSTHTAWHSPPEWAEQSHCSGMPVRIVPCCCCCQLWFVSHQRGGCSRYRQQLVIPTPAPAVPDLASCWQLLPLTETNGNSLSSGLSRTGPP